MDTTFKDYLLQITNAKSYKKAAHIQSLWSGYGSIDRFNFEGGKHKQLVIKHIDLRQVEQHPRGWNTNLSHQRKIRSYEVETAWYKQYADRCTADCKVPNLVGAFKNGQEQWIILEDLNLKYPDKLTQIGLDQIKVCLHWLAHFHATFLQEEPTELWPIGSYWHFDTRPEEFEALENGPLKTYAKQIDKVLNTAKYQTFIHGDAKLANFCFSEDHQKVAAVDFQYIGKACGIKDVMYFLSSCLSGEECAALENELLDYYFSILQSATTNKLSQTAFQALEAEWRKLYAFAWADFVRFLLGWMPGHYKLHDYSLSHIEKVLHLL
jgi:hypothetical protein